MRAVLVLAAVLALSPAARATDNDFKALVRAISAEYRTKPMSPWALRLTKAFLPPARKAMSGMDVAIFEDLGRGRTTPEQFFEKLNGMVGNAWKPFVKVRSKDETALMYMRQEQNGMRMLVVTVEPDEAVVVQMKLTPDRIHQWFDDPVQTATDRNNHDR